MKKLVLLSALGAASMANAGLPDVPAADARITRLETEMMALKAEVASIKAKCVCQQSPVAAAPQSAPVQYVQSCSNGVCSMVPVSGGEPMTMSAPSFSSGGGCANGQCGNSSGGRRGLFGRRR